jgi:hypothetical protein
MESLRTVSIKVKVIGMVTISLIAMMIFGIVVIEDLATFKNDIGMTPIL